jgi:aryl-alcohol dehydrogenase-like predicted oxidoreductase
MNLIGKERKIIDPRKVIYGTARFGDFGYGNSFTNPDSHDKIIETILELGIKRIDTAARYGSAEKILGKFSSLFPTDFTFDTKIDNLNISSNNLYEDIKIKVGRSFDSLRINQIGTLYIHENDIDIISSPHLIECLKKLKSFFPIEKIGTSIYSTTELEFCLSEELYDTIQIPINLISRGFYNIVRNRDVGKKEIIARSIYLQGILAGSNLKYVESLNNELYQTVCEVEKICMNYDSTLFNEAIRFIDETGLKFITGSSSQINIINGLKYLLNESVHLIENEVSYFIDDSFTYTNPRNWR